MSLGLDHVGAMRLELAYKLLGMHQVGGWNNFCSNTTYHGYYVEEVTSEMHKTRLLC